MRPSVGIVLGSGLGNTSAGRLKPAVEIPYESIPYFVQPTVAGHRGILHLGLWGEVPVAVLDGRAHLYEGYSPAEVVFSTRVVALLGAELLVLACAAGGIARAATPGTLMIFSDHLNFQGANPLAVYHDDRWGPRFVDMSCAYDPELRRQAGRAASMSGVRAFEGVYAAVLGPNYETPAEIQGLKRLGAEAVGMSTVPEVLAARQLGVRVLGLAMITNRAAGLSRGAISHKEVLELGRKATRELARFFDILLPALRSAGSI